MLIDSASSQLIVKTAERTILEKGKRLPLHSIHRWWSRRFSAIYRFILSSFLFVDESAVEESLDNPAIMREKARGKIFVEPFAGGGTGITEAAFAGWSVCGVDINPVATSISKASTFLATKGLPKGYKELAIKILDESLTHLENVWKINGKYISYIFISRDKAPTWISTKSTYGTKIFILMCPKCHTIIESPEKYVSCPYCGHEFSAEIKGLVKLGRSFPETTPGWKAYAIELRNPGNKWKKEYVSIKHREDVKEWLKETSKISEKICTEILGDIDLDINVNEKRRLSREANIKKIYQLFTKRQMASFYLFSRKSKELVRSRIERLLLGIALSESTKASTLASKWHPPIGEPVPAGAMKTYWIPKHTVEANPLAHIPNTLRPLGRNTIASALRMQLKADNFVKENNGPSNTKVKIITGDAEKVKLPKRIDLAVVDPPYMDAVKSYASLSLIHYAGLKIFDSVNKSMYVSRVKLEDVEKIEIPRERRSYGEKLYKIFSRLSKNMYNNSRVVLMYNRPSVQDWLPPLWAAKLAGLYPTSIYWMPGESPGSLARSKLRGIYLIILKKKSLKLNKLNILFKEIIKEVRNFYSINVKVETKSFIALKEALHTIYS